MNNWANWSHDKRETLGLVTFRHVLTQKQFKNQHVLGAGWGKNRNTGVSVSVLPNPGIMNRKKTVRLIWPKLTDGDGYQQEQGSRLRSYGGNKPTLEKYAETWWALDHNEGTQGYYSCMEGGKTHTEPSTFKKSTAACCGDDLIKQQRIYQLYRQIKSRWDIVQPDTGEGHL